ncbi:DUF3375 domain-containing protein [Desulfococcaceae bacterium HSG8]|nr:DUF3375 domain-containing protein [Desulfococcaceae bacterium HSG8]
MNYEKLTTLLSDSPAVKLLRAKNAPLILSFLYREFKQEHRLTIANHELVSKLSDYLEELNYMDEDHPYSDFLERSKRYIDDWCSEDNRYLRKFPDEAGTPVHELTPDTEKAFQWIRTLEKREFIGTESRFSDIFRKLRELVENSSQDPRKRVARLERKKRKIEEQIRIIEVSGKAETFSDTRVKERFYEISRLGRDLVSDFKEVEQNFKNITRSIYEKQTRENVTKGEILGYALDATDELKDSDQGKSFYTFWQFLVADHKQEELDILIGEVFNILEQRSMTDPDPFLQKMKIYLHHAGQKVVTSNHRMIGKLSRILGEKFLLERRKTVELIAEIRKLAIERIGRPPWQESFIEIEGDCDISMVMDRPIGESPRSASFAHQPFEIGNNRITGTDLEKLFNPFEIDREMLEQNIEVCLKRGEQVTLEEIVQDVPLKNGLAEIVAYLSIASGSRRHIINQDKYVDIEWSDSDAHKKIKMPQVIYGKKIRKGTHHAG